MNYELISFPTCPFVQRAVIVLLEKKVPHSVRYVEDLENPPDWFEKVSPRGRVPVLVAGGTPLFESQAICEYLDETAPGEKLTPSDPVERARDRAWFAFASEDLLFPSYQLMYGLNREEVEEKKKELWESLDRLDREMAGRNWLSGEGKAFGLADVAMAPFFYRAELYRSKRWIDLLMLFPNLEAWSDRINARASVKDSVPRDFTDRIEESLREAKAWIVADR